MTKKAQDSDACLLLEVAGHVFGIDLNAVKAVMPYQEPSPVPYQERAVLGALLHRGVFMGVTGLGRLLGMDAELEEGKAVIAVIDVGGGLIGLAADASRGVVRDLSVLEEVRVKDRVESQLVGRAFKAGTVTVNLLDLEALTAGLASDAGCA